MKKFIDFISESLPEPGTPGFNTFNHGHTTIQYSVHPSRPNDAEIHMVLTHKDHAGKGSAREAMKKFLDHTDKHGIRTHLTPEPLNHETKKTKLVKFYKSLGYVPNRGKNKDFSIRSAMLRNPSTN
jgi:GNAT superfamily N-acetyltransferase